MVKKTGDDFLKKMVIVTFALLFGYLAWCWAAKIIWGLDPPEGGTVAALATASTELLGCSVIQAAKTLTKKTNAEAELKAAQKENSTLRKQLTNVQAAIAGEQLKMGDKK